MTELKHPTNQDWCMFDPLIHPPAKGESLLVLNPGGVLVISQWFEGALAWAYKPKIPDTVKKRMANT